jgi:hypothetical protein
MLAQTVRHAFPFDPAALSALHASMPRSPPCREPMPDSARCVDHVGEPADHQQLVNDFAAIGSPAEWARRCGEAHGHDRTCWEAVANLVTLGTRKLDRTSLELTGFRRAFPDTSAGTFWIFWHTETNTNDKLYNALVHCLPCGPDTSRFGNWKEFAEMSVAHVEKTLFEDLEFPMKGSGKGKGATYPLVYRMERS